MAVPLETVVKQLTDSGIIAPGKLENFVPPKAHPTSADELVAELVKNNHLTAFQGAQVKAGKAKALILGNYTILDKIGAGGMGQVFKAEHRRLKRVVALKMLPPSVTKDAMAVARFQREVEAAAMLRHPNIVATDDADQAGAVHFLVMEYIEGKDLSALVKKNGPFTVSKAVDYVLQTAKGLEFAHKKGVVHRDIKPANLLLDGDGTVKILDMGLARIESDGGAVQAELTGTGTIMGTVDYMAPEQGMSTKHADARADIYSLGCSLYYLIAGKAAYDGETVAAKLVAHHNDPIPSLQDTHPEVPGQVDAVFKKMVAKKIDDRYQTMTEVVAALEKCQATMHAAASSSTGVWQAPAADQESELSIAFSHAREHLIPRVEMEEHKPKTKPERKARPKPSPVPSTRAQAERNSGRKRPVLIGLIAAGVLGAGILAAVIIVKMRTQDGTLIVEVNQPNALVQVLDLEGKVEISQPGGLTPISISVVPGKHRIRVEKDGFATIADNIDIESGGKLDIKARLVKATPVAAAATLLPPGEGFGASSQPSGGRRPDEGARPWNTSAFQAWVKATQALPAEKQIEAVSKKLMELNPGFDGKVTGGNGKGYGTPAPKIENGVVTEFGFDGENVTAISPVRALVGLRRLYLVGGRGRNGRLSDLSPLQGMILTHLTCHNTQVSDLSPLVGLPLTYLGCNYTQVSDLLPLEPCKALRVLQVKVTKVTSAGVAALQKALPNCKIEWDGPASLAPSDSSGPKPWNTPAFQQWVKATQALPAEQQIEAVSKKLMELNPGFDGKLTNIHESGPPKVENGAVTELRFHSKHVTDISPLRAFSKLTVLLCYPGGSTASQLSDLSPLQGAPLVELRFSGTSVSDLSPLAGMPLTRVQCDHTHISDLSPLEDCKALAALNVTGTKVTAASVAALQKALPNCKIEWEGPGTAAPSPQPSPPRPELGTKAARGEGATKKLAYLDPAFQQWVKATQALPAEKQVEAVSKKLMELNPGFDGKLTGVDGAGRPKTDNGVVLELALLTDNVTDVSPVRALAGLKVLNCNASAAAKARFSDLSPLAGLPLTQLRCENTKVSDLSPLRGMSLTILSCGGTNVSDLSPLLGMRLLFLNCGNTPVSDLSPLAGMDLVNLILTPKSITNGLDVIRQMKSLKIIGLRNDSQKFPAAEFWKKYDAGEFGKPAPSPSPLPLDRSSGRRP